MFFVVHFFYKNNSSSAHLTFYAIFNIKKMEIFKSAPSLVKWEVVSPNSRYDQIWIDVQ